jgi:hypothetical protein
MLVVHVRKSGRGIPDKGNLDSSNFMVATSWLYDGTLLVGLQGFD